MTFFDLLQARVVPLLALLPLDLLHLAFTKDLSISNELGTELSRHLAIFERLSMLVWLSLVHSLVGYDSAELEVKLALIAQVLHLLSQALLQGKRLKNQVRVVDRPCRRDGSRSLMLKHRFTSRSPDLVLSP